MIIDDTDSEPKKSPTLRSEDLETGALNPPPYTPSPVFAGTSDEKSLPTPPHSPPPSSGDPGLVPSNLPPPCNHLLQRRSNDSIKGVWQVDTAMSIPDALLVPPEEFDGVWNEMDQKARKERKKLEKKGKRRSDDTHQSPNVGIRPNLMLQSKNGSISAEVHVVPSDGVPRPTLVVVEGHNGSVVLEMKTYGPQPLRVFATSQNGSVRVRLPHTFEGAVIASTKNGSLKLSDAIKSKMTTFSAADTLRGYIGDWQTDGFGVATPAPSPNPNDDPPLPNFASDPFASWSGPLVHIASHNGTVHLSYSNETPAATEGGFSGFFRGFMNDLFGGGGEAGAGQATRGASGSGPRFPWGQGAPWGNDKHPWGNDKHPWGNDKFPWGNDKFPWGSGPPWAPTGQRQWSNPDCSYSGPFGRSGGSCVRGAGAFGRGCGPFNHGDRGWRPSTQQRDFGGGRVGSPRIRPGERPEEKAPIPGMNEGDLDPYGFPKDKKEPPPM
ncbi:hypothetical protein CTheo_6186 [Ceratobasidium theobromae]|uniref:DUF7330 domain-containing protein n=1 Tax=Ceratobasidium theobromae TaxID=1582974 RepID=A0A5N5QF58_9AGAM|nr:hypothetical protein CTheo_6186 [Ceratobasidium theobromae]